MGREFVLLFIYGVHKISPPTATTPSRARQKRTTHRSVCTIMEEAYEHMVVAHVVAIALFYR